MWLGWRASCGKWLGFYHVGSQMIEDLINEIEGSQKSDMHVDGLVLMDYMV